VTIQAIAVASGYLNSNLAIAAYSVAQPTPVLSNISPLYASTGSTFMLTVTGENFTPRSTINWGSVAMPTTYVSPTKLTTQITASIDNNAIAAGWESFNVTVSASEGGTSGAIAFDVVSPNSSSFPVKITPATATVSAGSSATFAVAFSNGALSNGSQCLNLPSGAACVYNDDPNTQSSGTLTVNTSSTTPRATYVITLACNETVPVASSNAATTADFMLPAILLPLGLLRRKVKVKTKVRGLSPMVRMGLLLLVSAALGGCGNVSKNETGTFAATTSATSAATITLTIQ
jgi:IPT/TIG domain